MARCWAAEVLCWEHQWLWELAQLSGARWLQVMSQAQMLLLALVDRWLGVRVLTLQSKSLTGPNLHFQGLATLNADSCPYRSATATGERCC